MFIRHGPYPHAAPLRAARGEQDFGFGLLIGAALAEITARVATANELPCISWAQFEQYPNADRSKLDWREVELLLMGKAVAVCFALLLGTRLVTLTYSGGNILLYRLVDDTGTHTPFVFVQVLEKDGQPAGGVVLDFCQPNPNAQEIDPYDD